LVGLDLDFPKRICEVFANHRDKLDSRSSNCISNLFFKYQTIRGKDHYLEWYKGFVNVF